MDFEDRYHDLLDHYDLAVRLLQEQGKLIESLVGCVVTKDGNDIVGTPVVKAGWVDQPGPGMVGDTIERRRSRGVPAYRVWRARKPS